MQVFKTLEVLYVAIAVNKIHLQGNGIQYGEISAMVTLSSVRKAVAQLFTDSRETDLRLHRKEDKGQMIRMVPPTPDCPVSMGVDILLRTVVVHSRIIVLAIAVFAVT